MLLFLKFINQYLQYHRIDKALKQKLLKKKPFQKMKRQMLQKLEQKDLIHYHKTLQKRVEQLKSFNVELAKDNTDTGNKIALLREQQTRLLHAIKMAKEPKKKVVNRSNFDFDDLYRMGVKKVGGIVSKEGVMGFLSVGEEKIRKGFGYAGSIVKKVMGKNSTNTNKQPSKEGENDDQNGNAKVRILSNKNSGTGSHGEDENINENADFNSYDVGNGRHFQHYQPKAEVGLEIQNTEVEKIEQITGQQKEKQKEGQKQKQKQKPKAPRKKIFDRQQQQQLLAQKRLLMQQSEQSPSLSSEQAHHHPQPQPQPQPQAQPQPSPPIKQSPQKPSGRKQIKELEVQPNKVVDLDLEPSDEEEEDKNGEKQAKVEKEFVEQRKIQVALKVKQKQDDEKDKEKPQESEQLSKIQKI